MLRLFGLGLVLASLGSSLRSVLAWRRGRAWRHSALLVETARALNVPPAGLDQCLDASAATLERWIARGVPFPHHARVRRLAATAGALRRHFPADDSRRLIELQRLAAASAAANRRWLLEDAGRLAASRRGVIRRGAIVITSR